MAKVNALVHSFNSGELSKAGLNRVDQEKVRLCSEIQENIFPYTVGKAIMRGGTEYLGTSWIGDIDNTPPRLIPFVKSIDTAAIMELAVLPDSSLKVWYNDIKVNFPIVHSQIGTLTSVLTGDATATVGTGHLSNAKAPNLGGVAVIKKQVTTSSPNIEHALEILVLTGEMEFKCGSADGSDDYISATEIGKGSHILSFTPTGSYWITFTVTSEIKSEAIITVYNDVNQVPPGSTSVELAVPAPWLAGALRGIRFDQSLDVVFLVIPDNSPYKIERRGNRSWSVTEYLTSDGPFTIGRSNSRVRLKPTLTRGNTTLVSDNPFFESSHVGVLFKLTHTNFNATFGLAAAGQYTQAWKQVGIVYSGVDDRAFSVTVAGTWVGTINIQRSLVDEFSGFEKFGADISSNGTTNVSGDNSDNNAIIWYRVTFTAYTSGSAQISVSYNGYGSSGICRVTHANSSTSADIEIISPFTDIAYTDNWQEGEWSSHNGFPTAVALFDGRLWWSRRDRFWGSVSDSYYNYDTTAIGDSAAIARAVATGGGFSDVQWILPLQRLIFGTSGSEASARSSSFDEPLKATGITVKDASNHGVANITPLKIDSRGIFVQRSGRKLMELGFNPQANDYGVVDLMRYNEDIGTSLKGLRVPGLVDDDIIEIAVQRHPETWIWCLRDDGVTPVLFYNPGQEGLGWFKLLSGQSSVLDGQFLAADKIVSVAVLPGLVEDSVYFIVQRRVTQELTTPCGGLLYEYNIEKLTKFQDSIYKILEDASTGSISTYNGLYQLDSYVTRTVVAVNGSDPPYYELSSAADHLLNSVVMIIGPHFDAGGNVVSYGPISASFGSDPSLYVVDDNGQVYIDRIAQPFLSGYTVTIGLPYTGRYKSAKLAYAGGAGGTALLQKKKVGPLGLLLQDYNPEGVQVGSDLDDSTAMDDLPAIEGGSPVAFDSTLIDTLDGDMFPFPGIWDTDSRVCIKVKPGYSATLNAIVIGVETHEK